MIQLDFYERRAVVLMTALVPTLGHKALIDFALEMVRENGHVDVILSSRSHEPVDGALRVACFEEHYVNDRRVKFIHHDDDNAPQTPSTAEEWKYWKRVVQDRDGYPAYDYLVASEPYGKRVADLIDAEFIPFDPDRWLIETKGTDVRDNLDWKFHELLPEFGNMVSRRITFFGQESTGKTTMTEVMSREYMSYKTHEFARPYLELMDDRTVTDDKMERITEGQYALQRTAYSRSVPQPFVFQDTDLLSTIGYYRIYGGVVHPKIDEWFEETASDLYVVMNDEIPFEEDALRYGGKERESTKQFWIDLLEEKGCRYYVVQSTDRVAQMEELFEVIDGLFNEFWKPIRDFVRE